MAKETKQKDIIIIGAGMAGLEPLCAGIGKRADRRTDRQCHRD